MDTLITISLDTNPEQQSRLQNLRSMFADACNAVAETALAHQCWNRVALHHMVYREMRERFPDLGSQMICNAVYSVCRACRIVFQNPASPFHSLLAARAKLPQLRFAPSAPVYFDRHTLSLRRGVLSLYTLEGRMKFRVTLNQSQEGLFQSEKLKEISLTENQGRFLLQFKLGQTETTANSIAKQTPEDTPPDFPEYLLIREVEITPPVAAESEMTNPMLTATQGSAQ